MIILPTRWRGVVTEDGKRFLADHHSAFVQALRAYAGREVIVRLATPLRPGMRGYWHAEIVPRFQELTGEPSKLVAHYQLLHLLDWTPGADRPSTADEATDAAEMADRIQRATALLTAEGVEVHEPDPDPVRRYERAMRMLR